MQLNESAEASVYSFAVRLYATVLNNPTNVALTNLEEHLHKQVFYGLSKSVIDRLFSLAEHAKPFKPRYIFYTRALIEQ